MAYHQPMIQQCGSPEIFFHFLNISPQFRVPPGVDQRAKKLKDFLDSHIPEAKWHLEDICDQLGLCMTCRQARRLFKACTGGGFVEYAKRRRLEFAAQQLRTTDAPIKVVGLDAGYRHVSTFSNSFTKYFHLCPTEFRRFSRRNVTA